MISFIHTADWQVGKPFGRIEDSAKRHALQSARLAAIEKVGEVAHQRDAAFVLVAGDLFDSKTPTRPIVSQTCAAIGQIRIPVLAIPGNHDHGGPGSVWEQSFFQQEQRELAPNLQVLLEAKPLVLKEAIILPCPLLQRHQTTDPTGWIHRLEISAEWGERPVIVLAHGSTETFASDLDEDDPDSGAINHVKVDHLSSAIDYVALGDWHGTFQVNARTWYAGTPEPDRFPKGESNRPGHVLAVECRKGMSPVVEVVPTGTIGWHHIAHHCADDKVPEEIERSFRECLRGRIGQDLVRLQLSGSLGMEAYESLEELIDTYQARLLHLRVKSRPAIAPTEEEITRLTENTADPLIAQVARSLSLRVQQLGEEGEIAALALRELYTRFQA